MTTTNAAFTIHVAAERGRTDLGWLDSRHSFSFGEWYDPSRTGFRTLRVLNDDRVAPGAGFGAHAHRDMEIISWVLAGALRHRDSAGNEGVLRPGDVQVMSAGSGIEHSEMNGSRDEPVHFLQVWIVPAEKGLAPRHEQRTIPAAERTGRWCAIASGLDEDLGRGAIPIAQSARVSIADLAPGATLDAAVAADHHAWLHVATGAVDSHGRRLDAGDAISWSGAGNVTLRGIEPAQVLLFDLA